MAVSVGKVSTPWWLLENHINGTAEKRSRLARSARIHRIHWFLANSPLSLICKITLITAIGPCVWSLVIDTLTKNSDGWKVDNLQGWGVYRCIPTACIRLSQHVCPWVYARLNWTYVLEGGICLPSGQPNTLISMQVPPQQMSNLTGRAVMYFSRSSQDVQFKRKVEIAADCQFYWLVASALLFVKPGDTHSLFNYTRRILINN